MTEPKTGTLSQRLTKVSGPGRLALLPASHPVEMRTTALEGEIHLDGRPSVVNIDLHQLRSDQRLRDRYVRGSMFPDHPTAVFTLQELGILPGGLSRWQGGRSTNNRCAQHPRGGFLSHVRRHDPGQREVEVSITLINC